MQMCASCSAALNFSRAATVLRNLNLNDVQKFSQLGQNCSRPEHNTNPSNQGRSSDFVLRPFIVPE